MFLCFFGFFAFGFLIVSTEIFSGGIDPDGRFLAVFVYDCLETFLAFARFFFNPKDWIVSSLIFNGGLDCRRQVLHFDRRFLVIALGRHAKGEANADYSCCNKVLRFRGYSCLTLVRRNLLKFYC